MPDTYCDQHVFNQLYARGRFNEKGTKYFGKIAIVSSQLINTRWPVTRYFSSHHNVLHLVGELEEVRVHVFREVHRLLCNSSISRSIDIITSTSMMTSATVCSSNSGDSCDGYHFHGKLGRLPVDVVFLQNNTMTALLQRRDMSVKNALRHYDDINVTADAALPSDVSDEVDRLQTITAHMCDGSRLVNFENRFSQCYGWYMQVFELASRSLCRRPLPHPHRHQHQTHPELLELCNSTPDTVITANNRSDDEMTAAALGLWMRDMHVAIQSIFNANFFANSSTDFERNYGMALHLLRAAKASQISPQERRFLCHKEALFASSFGDHIMRSSGNVLAALQSAKDAVAIMASCLHDTSVHDDEFRGFAQEYITVATALAALYEMVPDVTQAAEWYGTALHNAKALYSDFPQERKSLRSVIENIHIKIQRMQK